MAGIEDVDAEFIGESGGPVGPFTGHEGIDAFPGCIADFGSGAARHDPDISAGIGAAGQEDRGGTGGLGEALGEDFAGDPGGGSKSDALSLGFEEGAEMLEAECAGEKGAVAETRMGIERQMRTVDCEVAFHESADQFVAWTGPRMGGAPEKSVMDDKKLGLSLDGSSDGDESGIHRGGDASDGARVLDLESVHGAVPVLEFRGAEEAVRMLDQGWKRYGTHGEREQSR